MKKDLKSFLLVNHVLKLRKPIISEKCDKEEVEQADIDYGYTI